MGTRYFTKQVTDQVRGIRDELCSRPQERRTIAKLAKEYGLSETMLKSCFCELYGQPIAGYMKNYRLELAAEHLCSPDLSVMEIAAEVGYENPGKFSEAFRKKYGCRPSEYRRHARMCQRKKEREALTGRPAVRMDGMSPLSARRAAEGTADMAAVSYRSSCVQRAADCES